MQFDNNLYTISSDKLQDGDVVLMTYFSSRNILFLP